MAHILLVDDDKAIRHFLEKHLINDGHTVTSKDNGFDALQVFKDTPDNFDILLTDIVMPGMDGIELAKKSRLLKSKLKILFMTGFQMTTFKNDLALNRISVLQKPLHMKDVTSHVNALMLADENPS